MNAWIFFACLCHGSVLLEQSSTTDGISLLATKNVALNQVPNQVSKLPPECGAEFGLDLLFS